MMPKKSGRSEGLCCSTNKILQDSFYVRFKIHFSTQMMIFLTSKKKKEKNQVLNFHTPPCARPMAMIAAASITHDKGFHIKPRNLRILLSCEHQGEEQRKSRNENAKNIDEKSTF